MLARYRHEALAKSRVDLDATSKHHWAVWVLSAACVVASIFTFKVI